MKNEDIMDPGITDTAEAAPEQCKDKAYGKVILYVKDRIKAGDIKVGDKLPTERELSEMLNLSRNSVREALRTLDNMGLISCRQGSGNYLTGDLQGIMEESMSVMFMLKQIDDIDLSQLRRALDKQAIILAINNFSEANRAEIEDMLVRIEECEKTKAAFLDKEIHMLISKQAGNKLIELINDSLSKMMEKFISMARRIVVENEGDVLSMFHRDMLLSILEKDEEKGRRSVDRHYDIIDRYLK